MPLLDRHGLVERRSSRSRRRAQGTALSFGQRPNELWCTDYKGEFLLGNRQYCYPLTVTDHASRFLLTCEALSSTREDYAFTVFERLFQERGLPANIRSDNGVPFASPHALFNLSKLAVWWLRLGIAIERIQPGHPQHNGRHERMHLTLKKEATKPAAAKFLQQQARFDKFMEVFNRQRPHEALDMKCPAEIYQPSPRPYTGLPDIDYPFHDKTIVVTENVLERSDSFGWAKARDEEEQTHYRVALVGENVTPITQLLPGKGQESARQALQQPVIQRLLKWFRKLIVRLASHLRPLVRSRLSLIDLLP